MSGRCCLGQDDGNGIWRAASQHPVISEVAVTGITLRFSPAPFLDRPDRRRAIPNQRVRRTTRYAWPEHQTVPNPE
jgi:hypothetical protein